MAIRVQCSNPQCGKTHSCPDELAGKTILCPDCGTELKVPEATPAQPPQQQQKLGDYLLVRKLGQGGMGAVFEAVQTKLDRRVALKVLPKKFTEDPAFLERFQREAKAAAALNHPNIIQVHDIGEDKGFHFFSMEFVDGESAQKRLEREKKLPLKDALEIVEEVAKALQYAHTRSIIHRDIKPDNIMLTREGQVKLADLGLAKSTKEEKGVTVTGAGLGTPYYMAPEQAEDARHADHRADIYALGITLLHLLTGKRPFDGDSAYAIIIAHREKPTPSGRELGTELPPGIEALIQKMCAKKPEQRYQDYESFLADLERARAGQPTLASTGSEAAIPTLVASPAAGVSVGPDAPQQEVQPHAAGPAHRARAEKPRSKAMVLAGAGVAGVLLVGVAVFLATRSPSLVVQPSGGPSSLVVPPSGGKSLPDKSGATNKEGPLVVPPSGGSGQASAVGAKKPAEAVTTNKTEAGIAGMFREAEKYAQEHPEDFKEIIGRLETVQKRGEGTEYEFKANDHAKAWRTKWEAAAKAEFDKRKAEANAHIQAGRFDEAAKVWQQTPEGLLTEATRNLVEEEKKKLDVTVKSLAEQLSSQAEPLLAKEPETLTDEEVNSLSALKARAERAPAGLDEVQKQALASLVEKLEACLEACESAQAAKAAKAFDAFWDKFASLVNDRKFDEAEALAAANSSLVVPPSGGSSSLVVPASAGSGEEKKPAEAVTTSQLTMDRFVSDLRVLKDLFARAEANLDKLVGKTIRVGGIGMKVTEVRGGKVIVTQAGAEMAVGPEKLEAEELLKLGLATETDSKSAAYHEALFHFFYGRPARAKPAFAKVKGKDAEVAFYRERLAELEQGQENARAEKEGALLVTQIESAIKAEKVEAAESKLQKLEKDLGQTQAAKAHLGKLREQFIEAQSKAGAKKDLILIPAGKFIYQDGQEIDLPAFYIGKYEVSNAEYSEFLAWSKKEIGKGEKGDPHRFCYPGYLPDGKELSEEQLLTLQKMSVEKRLAAIQKLGLKGGEPGGKSHDNQKYLGDLEKPNHPVVGIDWYDAWAYCRWRGGRLPTEQEWEKAASWDPKRAYPWGEEFIAKWCNSNAAEDGFAQTCPVNEFPKGASAYGCFNMAGNVWEWCDSWYDPGGRSRVDRGGSWDGGAAGCWSASHNGGSPDARNGSLGCRVCLRSSP